MTRASSRQDEFDGRPELIRMRARQIFMWRIVAAIGGLFMVASMTVLVYNAVQSIATRNAIVDCTTPDGECYQGNQEATAIVIQQLQRITVIASSCAARLEEPTVPNVTVCVMQQLDRDEEIRNERARTRK